MSAKLDTKQPIRFHYGVARTDLAAILPPDDFNPASLTSRAPYSEIFALLDSNERTLKTLTQSRAKLSFLIKDLKRLMS